MAADRTSPLSRVTATTTEFSGGAQVAMSEVLASLSRALDLTEGQPMGHSVRACVIGMRLGESVGLGEEQLAELYYALLLKDAEIGRAHV